jgi:uncharacterized protein with FMN-binding domain
MKKVIIAIGIVVIFAAYIFYQHEHQPSTSQTPVVSTSTGNNQPSPTDNNSPPTTPSAPATSTTPTTPMATQTSGQYKDGTYTGTVADAVYGKLQVIAVVQGGKITDVQFPVYPNDPGHTTDVSNQALPQLKSEAIAAQNANVDVVSGATQDSQAFVQSLQSALNQAKS